MTSFRHSQLQRPLMVICFVIGGLVLLYVGSSQGAFDLVIEVDRTSQLRSLDDAMTSEPPDIVFLTQSLRSSDWYIAARAADRLRILRLEGRLEGDKAALALSSLIQGLASGGHWWRFGWDREETDYEAFRGAAIEAVAAFGEEGLPYIVTATTSRSPDAREAACWVLLTMLKRASIDPDSGVITSEVSTRVQVLADNDESFEVRVACGSVQDWVASHESQQ